MMHISRVSSSSSFTMCRMIYSTIISSSSSFPLSLRKPSSQSYTTFSSCQPLFTTWANLRIQPDKIHQTSPSSPKIKPLLLPAYVQPRVPHTTTPRPKNSHPQNHQSSAHHSSRKRRSSVSTPADKHPTSKQHTHNRSLLRKRSANAHHHIRAAKPHSRNRKHRYQNSARRVSDHQWSSSPTNQCEINDGKRRLEHTSSSSSYHHRRHTSHSPHNRKIHHHNERETSSISSPSSRPYTNDLRAHRNKPFYQHHSGSKFSQSRHQKPRYQHHAQSSASTASRSSSTAQHSRTDEHASSSASYNEHTSSSGSHNEYASSSASHNEYTPSSASHDEKLRRSSSYNRRDASRRVTVPIENDSSSSNDCEDTLASLGVGENMLKALAEQGITKATSIQSRAIPVLRSGRSAIIAEQTGTGKTLAYLVPLIERMKEFETQNGRCMKSGEPRAIIVAPSRELANQILSVAKSLSHSCKFTSAVIIGGQLNRRKQRCLLSKPCDLMVATPGRLRQLLTDKSIILDHVKTLVCDEADTLFDGRCGFMEDLHTTTKSLLVQKKKTSDCSDTSATPIPTQLVFVSATMHTDMQRKLERAFGNLQRLCSNTLHRTLSSLQTNFVEVGGRDKQIVVVDILNSSECTPGSTIVFCNSIDSCRSLDYTLNHAGIRVASVHGDIPAHTRDINFSAFKKGENGVSVLVASDLACRGLDLTSASHVILFDFPRTHDDFLHRAGRTARAGRSGLLTALVTKRDKQFAREVQTAIRDRRTVESGWHVQSSLSSRRSPARSRHLSSGRKHRHNYTKKLTRNDRLRRTAHAFNARQRATSALQHRRVRH